MKRLILVAGMVCCLSAVTNAQGSGGNNGSRNKGSVSNARSSHHAAKAKLVKKPAKGKKPVTKTVILREDVIYKWQNGQSATPTGQEAAAVNGGYAAIANDTVNLRQSKPKRKQ